MKPIIFYWPVTEELLYVAAPIVCRQLHCYNVIVTDCLI